MSVLLIEAFYGGSHKQLVDVLHENIEDSVVYTLPAKKWHWRARTSALYFMQNIPESPSYRVLLASSVLNLAELVALRPDLGRLRKVLYFHENQLIYPVRKAQDRDFQYGYNQVLSCLVADTVLFNSAFNMESFLASMSSFFKTIPDHRPKDLDRLIRPKCQVLHFPIRFPDVTRFLPEHKLQRRATGSHIGCAAAVPLDLSSHGRLSVPTSSTSEASSTSEEDLPVPSEQRGAELTPEPQSAMEDQRGPERLQPPTCPPQGSHTGPQPQPPLHIVWPHRWLEAVHCGCYPLCPKALVYPEIFPAEYLYSTPEQLCKRLQGFCKRPDVVRRHAVKVDTGLYSWEALGERFRSALSAEGHGVVTAQAQDRAGPEGSPAVGGCSPSPEPTGVS
ncbi:glycosyltransferase-like domain-containing protein 1 isoform X2 [Sardina pilchardus]|uniref:glycosyltransferase-like domain-containing protein 1 isoform X2 n=1 Tax=Sardina pilchardus TaxID=27697 RepID=UPI002E121F03